MIGVPRRSLLVGLAAALLALVPALRAAVTDSGTADESRFPHAEHTGLFPTCTGCHGGVLAADSTAVPLMGAQGTGLYPTPAQCAGCHDGTRVGRVDWNGPVREPSNLRFSHAEHHSASELGDLTSNCAECHQQAGRRAFMAVAKARPEPCIACHGHPAPAHLADASPCLTCHVPVTRATAMTAAQLREFPTPPSHAEPGFLSAHAPTTAVAQARCAVCHARESCERCHVNAAALPQVVALGRDPRLAELTAGRAPEYPLPDSHQRTDWPWGHGPVALRGVAQCANCHTQPGCRSCHIGTLGAASIARLPAGTGDGRGVPLRGHDPAWPPAPPATAVPPSAIPAPSTRSGHLTTTSDGDVVLQGQPAGPRQATPRDTTRRVRVHPPDFERNHAPAAATERVSCSGCHDSKRFCTDCHDGEGRRRFHPGNFLARHSSDAYARQAECAACHSREGFCGACHQRAGLVSQGRLNVAFHTAQPLWLIQHGRAARQGLESCTTCHVQRDCTQCHSVTGWSVNPHGPGFDPRRMAARNAQVCRACHIGDPLRTSP